MIQRLLYSFLVSLLPACVFSQGTFIEGRVSVKGTGETIPYAKVYNLALRKSILSDENGYFRMPVRSYSDSVQVRMVGFRTAWIDLNAKTDFYEVYLEENARLLSEVTIRPEDNAYLYKLMSDCRRNAPGGLNRSKMYFELKSFVENKQVELVESFYNGEVSGYDLEALHLKTGRFALRDFDHTFFGSLESSKAITMFKLTKDNAYFPIGPFELSAKELRSAFRLHLAGKYRDEQLDSVYIVEFTPKDPSGKYFRGRAWITQNKKELIRTELHCEHATRHPFLPIFPTDTIQNLDLHITRSFEKVGGKMCFRHIDLHYETTYKNRSNTTYKALTQAVLFAYDFERRFVPPTFTFPEIQDFKKISAVPYNGFFWQNHDELKLSDRKDQNEAFFNSPASTTNRTIFSGGKFDRGIYEAPYLTWSKDRRIRFREFSADQSERKPNPRSTVIVSELYNLEAKVYLDVYPFPDTLQILTTTVMDPYESYYKLPMSKAALYFINVYFDLVEIERRTLESAIASSDRKPATIDRLYYESERRQQYMEAKYFREAEHGQNEKGMEKWNRIVFESLGIDNLGMLNPYAAE